MIKELAPIMISAVIDKIDDRFELASVLISGTPKSLFTIIFFKWFVISLIKGITGMICSILSDMSFNNDIPDNTSLNVIPKLANINPDVYFKIVVRKVLINPIIKNPEYNLNNFFNKNEFLAKHISM